MREITEMVDGQSRSDCIRETSEVHYTPEPLEKEVMPKEAHSIIPPQAVRKLGFLHDFREKST